MGKMGAAAAAKLEKIREVIDLKSKALFAAG